MSHQLARILSLPRSHGALQLAEWFRLAKRALGHSRAVEQRMNASSAAVLHHRQYDVPPSLCLDDERRITEYAAPAKGMQGCGIQQACR
eukprot:SAG31_NODE_1287_length_8999_cov_3.844382_2_plen_89_part_00